MTAAQTTQPLDGMVVEVKVEEGDDRDRKMRMRCTVDVM